MNLDSEGRIEDFQTASLGIQKFQKDISDSSRSFWTSSGDLSWDVTIGNDRSMSRTFYGALKDVRLWSSARTAAQIYSNRFVQVAGTEPFLKANF